VDFQWGAYTSRAHDPDIPALFWTVPEGASIPVKILGYQYEIDRWFLFSMSVEWVQTTYFGDQEGVMDVAPIATQDMDVVSGSGGLGDVNMDSLGGVTTESFSVFRKYGASSHEVYSFVGSAVLTGYIETGDFMLENSDRGYVKFIRPFIRGENAQVVAGISGRNDVSDVASFDFFNGVNAAGVIPVGVSGRFLRALILTAVEPPGVVDQLQGFDAVVTSVGSR
jgi:hypothetical protein